MMSQRNRVIPASAVCMAVVVSWACTQAVPLAVPALPAVSHPGAANADTADLREFGARGLAGERAAYDAAAVGGAADAATVEPAAASPAVGPTAPLRGTVAVRRGPIAETLQLNGRVVGLDEVPLSFPIDGTLKNVAVEAGQAVQPGQVLLELDTKQVAQQLAAARARAETARIRLDQAHARAEMDRRAAEQQAIAAREQAEATTRAAEVAVALARASLDRAEADLARLLAPPSPAVRQAAEQQVATARVALQRAQAEYERLSRGPDPATVRAAEREVANAQAALNTAQADLRRLSQGPDPAAVRLAELQLEQARASLSAVEATDLSGFAAAATGPGGVASARAADAARQSAIATARMAVITAQDRLNRLREPPDPAQVEATRHRLTDTQLALAAAQDRLDLARRGPDPLAVDAAAAELDRSRAALEQAEEQLRALLAGPPEDQVRQATSAVENAQIALANAETQLVVARARSQQPPVPPRDDARAYDLLLLERGLDQELATVQTLESDLASSLLKAPFAGVVASVPVQRGAAVLADRPVLVLTRGRDPVVVLPILPADVARVRAGQSASVQVDGGDGTRFPATVLSVERSPAGTGGSVRLQVDWGGTRPGYGETVRASIVVAEKADALLVPRRAVRTTGERQYVEYLVGDSRQVAEVTVGLTTTDDAEILSGVTEDMLLVVP